MSSPFDWRRARIAALFAATVIAPNPAYADSADTCDSCDSDAPCSVADRCPESGTQCDIDAENVDYGECVDEAEAGGLEFRCSNKSGNLYCAPGEEIYVEEEGCSLKSPKRPAGGIGLAAITFAAAAGSMLVRARSRSKER